MPAVKRFLEPKESLLLSIFQDPPKKRLLELFTFMVCDLYFPNFIGVKVDVERVPERGLVKVVKCDVLLRTANSTRKTDAIIESVRNHAYTMKIELPTKGDLG